MLNIVIPVYKARDTLPTLLASLAAQTYKMFIVTISQDGDGEDYKDIIKTYRDIGLHIQLVQSEKNGGPGMARQVGLDSSGMCDYVMFCDADDVLTPRAVEVLYKEAKRNLVDILSSDFIAETEYDSQYMAVQKTPITWFHGKIYRIKYLKENNIRFLEGLRLNEDSYFNLVAINCTEKKKQIPEYTYIWRYKVDSLTHQKDDGDFFERSWQQYILSQVKGLEKIIEVTHKINVPVLAATLLNLYNHCMKAIFILEGYDEVKGLLNELKEIPEIQQSFNEKYFWQYIHSNLRSCDYADDNLFFFKERFIDWFTEYILYNPDLIEHSGQNAEKEG